MDWCASGLKESSVALRGFPAPPCGSGPGGWEWGGGVLWKGFKLQVSTGAQHGLSAGVNVAVNVALSPSGRRLCLRGDRLGLVGANRHATPLWGWGEAVSDCEL